jgi:hypothetical protein
MYSKEIAERVKEFLVSRNYAWSFNDGSGVFRVGFNLHNKLSRCEVIGETMEQSTPTALVEEIDQQVTPSNAGIC